MRYSLARNGMKERRKFDPNKEEDLKELKHFINTNQWISGCPFYLEDEWDNIPVMCMHKYTHWMLNKRPVKAAKSQK